MNSLVSQNKIRRVVVLLAGSRTGSSFLFERLKKSGYFLTLTGEDTPLLRSAELGIFDGPNYDDSLSDQPPAVLEKAIAALASDMGVYDENGETDFHSRLRLQWPALGEVPAPKGSYRAWIDDLKARGYPVEPRLFSAAANEHPTNLALIEEPPYVVPEPKRALTEEDAESCPLLLKTSTNLYRLPFLRALFPKAEFKWIILQRNPAATVSALMDGWLSTAFHSHDVQPHTQLEIENYSEVIPGGGRYWKFDMPPGWRAYRRAKLVEVCAFQWLSAYRRLARFKAVEPVFKLHYEDLLTHEHEILNAVIDFAGAQARTAVPSAANVMTVSSPRSGKWKKRKAEIASILKGELKEVAASMNYTVAEMESWP